MKNIIISTKNIELTSELNTYIQNELETRILPKIEEHIKVKVLIQNNNNPKGYKVDIDVRIENIKVNSCFSNENLENCVKHVIGEIESKVKRINKKLNRREATKVHKQLSKLCDDVFVVRKSQAITEYETNYKNEVDDSYLVEDFEFVKSKKLDLKPMSPSEAVLQMNLTGHFFFLFLNSKTNEKAVVYERYDGRYGIIE